MGRADDRRLINKFPTQIDTLTRIVLASALATRVSWEVPFAVAQASGHLAETSPWRRRVERLLWDRRPRERAMLADTRAAGIVAVHHAVAKEDLTVISVSADQSVPHGAVLEAAHELAAWVRAGSPPPGGRQQHVLDAAATWRSARATSAQHRRPNSHASPPVITLGIPATLLSATHCSNARAVTPIVALSGEESRVPSSLEPAREVS